MIFYHIAPNENIEKIIRELSEALGNIKSPAEQHE